MLITPNEWNNEQEDELEILSDNDDDIQDNYSDLVSDTLGVFSSEQDSTQDDFSDVADEPINKSSEVNGLFGASDDDVMENSDDDIGLPDIADDTFSDDEDDDFTDIAEDYSGNNESSYDVDDDSENADEYNEDENDDDDEDDDGYYEDDDSSHRSASPAVKFIVILLIFLLLGGGAFFFMKNKGIDAIDVVNGVKDKTIGTSDVVDNEETDLDYTYEIDDDGNELAVIDIDVDDSDLADNTSAMDGSALADMGYSSRSPFAPSTSMQSYMDSLSGGGADIPAPPSQFGSGAEDASISNTKVVGILYDESSPSAIVNISGVEQIVHKGDLLYGYTIKDITPNKLVVQSGKNSFVAVVGDSFIEKKVGFEAEIYDLDHKFGGRYN